MKHVVRAQQNIKLTIQSLLVSLIAALVLVAVPATAELDSAVINLWQEHDQASQIKVDHGAWQATLNAYLVDEHPSGVNRFDYAAVSKADKEALSAYVVSLQAVDPRALNKDEQLAYWINLYNAGTVSVILENYPVKSIRDIRPNVFAFSRGPWDHAYFSVVGADITLNDIEHGILRPIWNDPRLHFVLNCASIGCPDLAKSVFTAANTQAQLESAAHAFLQHPRAVLFDDGRLKLSSLFDWYADDFGSNQAEILEFISQYADLAELDDRHDVEIEYHYDWTLNKP